jgi:type IV pilus assembly protein PilE
MRRRNRGVTLIELITVMVIVGILTAVAIPGYRNYVIRANRTDAKTALFSAAAALERCYTRNNTYLGCPMNLPLLVGGSAGNENYRIEVDPTPANGDQAANITAQSFALRAVPLNAQAARDATGCGSFQIDNQNRHNITGTKQLTDCWDK